MWRGEPLARFSIEPWAQAEINRLTALRTAAIEERVDLRLVLGHHGELAAELEELTARYPLQERLHGQLMLALYRSGRQADALAAYQRLRHTLDDELGLAPSAEVRALEQAVLRQDAKLGAPIRVRPSAQHNLPVRLTSFIGRGREVDEAIGLLGQSRLVTLTGPAIGRAPFVSSLLASSEIRRLPRAPAGVSGMPPTGDAVRGPMQAFRIVDRGRMTEKSCALTTFDPSPPEGGAS